MKHAKQREQLFNSDEAKRQAIEQYKQHDRRLAAQEARLIQDLAKVKELREELRRRAAELGNLDLFDDKNGG